MPRERRAVAAVAMTALIAVLTAMLVALSSPARGQLPQPPDSDAPSGAPPHWLPSEEWVMQHWLPYDEDRLLSLLRVDRTTLWRHLRDDRRTLAMLAARRGWSDARRLAAALVAPRQREVSPALARTLQARALRTLTQGHLSQHILFHSLHQGAVPGRARELFGVPTVDEFKRLRRLDISPLQIARMNGRSRAEVHGGAVRALREYARAGVQSGEVSPRQARILLARQRRQLPRWLSESHYNGPPSTDHTGHLEERPVPAWAAPAVSADGEQIVVEAYEPKLPLALARGEISVLGWNAGAGASAISAGTGASVDDAPCSAYNPALAGDGRRVAYETSAGNSNFAKRYGDTSVVLADRATGHQRRVSTRTAYAPAISADGRVVAFHVAGGDPRSPSSSHRTTLQVWELGDRSPRRLPRPAAQLGVRAAGDAYEPSLSGDGRFVAFSALTRGPGGQPGSHVYLHDRRSGRTRLVSRADGVEGVAGDGESWGPRVSADGRRVAFASTASTLGGRAPRPGEARVYVRDMSTATTRLASGSGTRALPGFASEPAISADGTIVAFSLAASGARANGQLRPPQAVYVRDLRSPTPQRIARTSRTDPRYAAQPALSADGTRLAFTAEAAGGILRVFLHDRTRSATAPLQLPSSLPLPSGNGPRPASICRLAPPAW